MSGINRKVATALVAGAVALGTVLGAGMTSAVAAEWSDTSIGYRYGTKFREPFNNEDISKSIIDLQHVSGYKYGVNFFNVDFLMSDSNDPGANSTGAQEAYLVYRNTVDLAKVTGGDYKFGIVRDIGGTFGFDWNTKNDVGYSSKKRMLVIGPTVMMDVPGFLNVSVLALWESNAPVGITSRYDYDTHAMLDLAWGIPIGSSPFRFQGYFDVIAPKGKDEFGGDTKTEIHFDGAIMLDVGRIAGGPKDMFKVGLEYEYWENKFGNDHNGPAGDGAFAKTPMIRAEYHF
ncbi:MAG: outer envelope protein [Betaproteobacteria bacterium]|nr:outer envelope protein [Betaproteobacteria bacterium]